MKDSSERIIHQTLGEDSRQQTQTAKQQNETANLIRGVAAQEIVEKLQTILECEWQLKVYHQHIYFDQTTKRTANAIFNDNSMAKQLPFWITQKKVRCVLAR